jgi:hypothetical protein
MPPWQKLSLAQFLLRKLLGETGSKRFNILVILGKKSWLFSLTSRIGFAIALCQEMLQ